MTDFSYRRTYKIGKTHKAEFILRGCLLEVSWYPDVPTGRVQKRLMPKYLEAQNDFWAGMDMNTLHIML